MNENNPPPPPGQYSPNLPLVPASTDPFALGADPSDCVPIPNLLAVIDALLRHPRRIMFRLREPGAGKLIASMFLVTLICSLTYGAVAGSFTGGAQIGWAAVKIAAGLLVSAVICLPSLYILACLGGSQARPAEICGLLAGLLTLMTILLVGFAPVAWIFSQSTSSLASMGALHLVFWLVATAFGLRYMVAGFSHTKARSRAGLNVWVVVFLLVALQMTTALRPILGHAPTVLPGEKQFFLGHWADCLSLPAESPANTPSR